MPHQTKIRAEELAALAPVIVDLYHKGHSIKKEAKRLGVSHVWAYDQLLKAGVKTTWRRSADSFDTELDGQAKELYDQGYGLRLIAKLLGKSKTWAEYALLRAGTTMRPVPPQLQK